MDENEELPSDLEWYRNQVAGHHPSVIRSGIREIGIIKVRNSKTILKVVQEGVRGVRETEFYENVKNLRDRTDEEIELIKELRIFLPFYFGLHTLNIGQKPKQFFQLEDITEPFSRPCIMDIKIGKVTYDPTADAKKRLAESSKCACQPIFGFRMLGYQINAECDEPRSRDRVWGKALTEENIQQAFEEYLLRGWPSESLNILDQFIERITAIQYWFNRQRTFNFYASSLLLVYEGQASPSTVTENNSHDHNSPGDKSLLNTKSFVDVRMIDFSHVFPANELDHNYIHGLNYILKIFTKIRHSLSTTGKP